LPISISSTEQVHREIFQRKLIDTEQVHEEAYVPHHTPFCKKHTNGISKVRFEGQFSFVLEQTGGMHVCMLLPAVTALNVLCSEHINIVVQYSFSPGSFPRLSACFCILRASIQKGKQNFSSFFTTSFGSSILYNRFMQEHGRCSNYTAYVHVQFRLS
jgi:hypothetical protein